ncbi:MAG: Fur family transcriptional regulator [Verrucomicrobiota bacterium]
MSSVESARFNAELNQKLATSGFRFTPQRQHVYEVLLEHRDHPTAEEVFMRSKQTMPDISMATVYNCLDALVKCGLVRQVNLDRTASRYCPNMKEHCHFYCDECGRIYDIDLDAKPRVSGAHIPDGFRVNHLEVSIRGCCPECAGKKK